MLTCPICHAALALEGRTYRCDRGHAFDRAREGYVDLLPVGHGKSGITGDTREMARARQRFLAAGHYDPLRDRLIARVRAHLGGRGGRAGGCPVVVEAGCGVGHYVGAIRKAVQGSVAYGFDVSREALRLAARAHPDVVFAVNDVKHRLCLADASADVLLDIFAPRAPREFRRVLHGDGLLAVVIPGEEHLSELRDRYPLLGIHPEKQARTVEQLAPAFRVAWEDALEWTTDLDADALADLVGMTPSAFHLPSDAMETPSASKVTMSFVVLGFSGPA